MNKQINFTNFYETLLSGPRNPKKEFIQSGRTYKEIFELAGRIKGIANDSKNTICLCTDDKSIIIAAMLASLADGASLVIPYSFSERVIQETNETVGFSKVIADKIDGIPPGIEVISTDQLCEYDISTLKTLRDPDSVFLRLFTGGSTGRPRVWSKTPRNIFSEALYLSQKFEISENDLFVSTVPPHHIYGLLFSIITPFISSARVIGNVCTFPQEIISSIENNATILIGVPMNYRILKGSSFKGHSLRTAFSSGGMLDEADAAYFHSQTGIGIVEVYGATETGGIATRCRVNGEEAFKPFDNIEWKIENERLHIKSEFISSELAMDDKGFFITGDRASCHSDKGFILQGRADGIVKVAGKRVDLGEVQDNLKRIPNINDAAVISLPARNGRMNEIAALVECDMDETTLRQAMSLVLESYAIPRRIKIIEKIPLSAAGKLDRGKIERLFQSD